MADGGKDGARDFRVQVRISGNRFDARMMRARPGTFEWRYARKSKDAARYHAGNHLAVLWEQAGTAAARSPDLGGANVSTGWGGLPDGRVAALDELRRVHERVGTVSASRLRNYVAEGFTTKEIAEGAGVPERAMSVLIDEDLRQLAILFRFLAEAA